MIGWGVGRRGGRIGSSTLYGDGGGNDHLQRLYIDSDAPGFRYYEDKKCKESGQCV